MENVILLATYNGEKYLREQINSIFAQTIQDFSLVIHDDGSSDGTTEIISEYRNKYPDRLEVLYGNPTGSAKANFMWMLQQVNAHYYFLCDQDDVWNPQKLEMTLKCMRDMEYDGRHEPLAVFTDMQVVDDELNELSSSFIRYIGRDIKNISYTQILIDNPAAGCTMCINRELRDIAISSSEIDWDNVPMHDAWLLEIGAIFGRVQGIDRPTVMYRQTGYNTMGAKTESETDKLARNVELAGSGGFFSRKRSFIYEARNFAGEILRLDNIPAEKKEVLEAFVAIERRPKIARIKFYKDNNFTRARHNFWMRLWV